MTASAVIDGQSLAPLNVTRLAIATPSAVFGWQGEGFAVRMECAGHPVVRTVEIARQRHPVPRPSTMDADLLHVLVETYLSQPRLAGRRTFGDDHGFGWILAPRNEDGACPEEFAVHAECWMSPGSAAEHPRLVLLEILRALDLSEVPEATAA
ncbi:MAG: hypothetical protein H3C62_00330 [Gemmatimonadaceae bacterium]|nr:hypothetical protein [Gemmatimonadaceae bacterium]